MALIWRFVNGFFVSPVGDVDPLCSLRFDLCSVVPVSLRFIGLVAGFGLNNFIGEVFYENFIS